MTDAPLRTYDDPTREKLSDGSEVEVRSVHPNDRPLLAAGFERLSPESRYLRFLTPKPALTEHELEYLTNPDGYDHFAIGAVHVDANGNQEPLGIARFVRLEPGGDVAEPAVAVIDDAQGKGLGKILLHLLADAAYERGVRRFRCNVLATNTPMQKMLETVDPHAHVVSSASGVSEVEIDLPTPAAQPTDLARARSLDQILAMVARELIAIRSRKHTPSVPPG